MLVLLLHNRFRCCGLCCNIWSTSLCCFNRDQVIAFEPTAFNTVLVIRKNRYFIVDVGSHDRRITKNDLERWVFVCAVIYPQQGQWTA